MHSRPSVAATCVLLALAGSAGRASAEPPTPAADSPPVVRSMTIEQAIEHARKSHPRIASARLRIAAATREADVPGAQWLPRVGAFAQVVGASVNNSTTTQIGVSTVDIPRIGATPLASDPNWNIYPSTMVAVGVRQQIYDFGRIAAETAAASLAVEVEKARASAVGIDVDFFVEQAFYAVLAAKSIEAASKNAFDRAVAHRDFARANVTSGLRPPIELTRAEADVARYEAGMTRARGSVHVARSVLAAAIAVDDGEIDAAGTPPSLAALPSLADSLRLADFIPAVREIRARIEVQRAETKRLEVQNRPSLFATAAVNGRAGGAPPNSGPEATGDGWIPLVPNYNVGAILAWPIVEPIWSRRADVSREREHALEADARQVVIEQRTAITTAWQDADVAASTLGALQRGADAAKANYEQAEQRFKVGLGTSTELADAQALRTDAEIQLAMGNFQTARARLLLGRVVAQVGR